MQEKLRFLGLDVHAETIADAIAEPDGEVRSLGTIPNRAESIRKSLTWIRLQRILFRLISAICARLRNEQRTWFRPSPRRGKSLHCIP
jgi:hypothetical protein